jgi:hypothetical protein
MFMAKLLNLVINENLIITVILVISSLKYIY